MQVPHALLKIGSGITPWNTKEVTTVKSAGNLAHIDALNTSGLIGGPERHIRR